ncbi:hypothetical protein Desku_3267 [Desulfofundulus kuznetsovii DSM 6115]|uniref:DUF2680 domain-containing protein n=2 Tax=Desulfofundulus TaxID=2282741 RepID=A0AAU8PF79_DESK7|nr:hypothetical protein Desku_3267 [Desulfofundulus kuznetsovii DSM 6115]
MKKRLAKVLAGVLVVGALVVPKVFAYGDTQQDPDSQTIKPLTQTTQQEDFYSQMFDWHKTWVDNAEKNGQITPEQAQAWRQHFDYMKDLHSKNGMGMGMMGGFGNGGMMGAPSVGSQG